jgi:hypothetical protein
VPRRWRLFDSGDVIRHGDVERNLQRFEKVQRLNVNGSVRRRQLEDLIFAVGQFDENQLGLFLGRFQVGKPFANAFIPGKIDERELRLFLVIHRSSL